MTCNVQESCGKRKWWVCLVALLVSCLVTYGLFSYMLSLAWFKGDDYLFATHDVFSLSHLYGAIHAYLNRVSRVGEIIANLLGIMDNRWQHWVLTPIFLVVLPFALVRLVCKQFNWGTIRGLMIFLFVVFLALQSVRTDGYWRSFWCFAAAVNYFWPMVVIFAFLPVFFPWKWGEAGLSGWRKWFSMMLPFILGVYSGWGSEAMTVTLLPLIICWLVYLKLKGKRVSMRCWSGFFGFCLGAFFLFASPALGRRAVGSAQARALDVLAMSPEDISAYVENLTPEKIHMLVDGSGVVNLQGIPLWEHIYFLPYLAEEYWGCCNYPTFILLVLAGLTLLLRPEHWKRNLVLAASMYLVSWGCACSYLMGAVPGAISFLPPSFIIVAACVLLIVNLKGHFGLPCTCMVVLVVVGTGMYLLLPPAIEAHHYKKYEHEKFAEIERQKAAGVKHVVLHRTWPAPPKDALGMICSMELGPDPEAYPNSCARHYYGVEGISLLPEIKRPEASKDATGGE